MHIYYDVCISWSSFFSSPIWDPFHHIFQQSFIRLIFPHHASWLLYISSITDLSLCTSWYLHYLLSRALTSWLTFGESISVDSNLLCQTLHPWSSVLLYHCLKYQHFFPLIFFCHKIEFNAFVTFLECYTCIYHVIIYSSIIECSS